MSGSGFEHTLVRGDIAIQKARGPWDGEFLLETGPVAIRRAGRLGARLAWGESGVKSHKFNKIISPE